MTALTPCLQLVAPAGMDQETQATWFDAAMLALEGYPTDLVGRGAKAAMLKADHPSKVVPLIVAEIVDSWRGRRDSAARGRPAPMLMSPPRAPIPRDETQRIIREAGLNMTEAVDPSRPASVAGGSDRPARIPTRADYIRMGVDPAVLDSLADDSLRSTDVL